MKIKYRHILGCFSYLLVLFFMTGCMSSDSSSSDDPSDDSSIFAIAGTISSIPLNSSSNASILNASTFRNNQNPSFSAGQSSVAGGVTVKLIVIDSDGNQLGLAMASSVTDRNGKYRLTRQTGFQAGANYVVRAMFTNSSLDAMVTGSTTDVDPISDATRNLVTDLNDNISDISATGVDLAMDGVAEVYYQMDTGSLTGSALAGAIKEEAGKNSDLRKAISNLSQQNQICGKITDYKGQTVADAVVTALHYSNYTTYGFTKTDASGNYCVKVPAGDYKLFIGSKTDNLAAGGGYKDGGIGISLGDATVVTVYSGMLPTVNIELPQGVRVEGSIKTSDGTAVSGNQVLFLDYDAYSAGQLVFAGIENTDMIGEFAGNILPGSYLIIMKNRSPLSYATLPWDDSTQSLTSFSTIPQSVDLVAGTTKTLSIVLTDSHKGYRISGRVADSSGSAIPGLVAIRQGGPLIGTTATDLDGNYAYYLADGGYQFGFASVYSYVVVSGSAQVLNFTPTTLKFKVQNQNGDPVSDLTFRTTDQPDITSSRTYVTSDSNGMVNFVYPMSGGDTKSVYLASRSQKFDFFYGDGTYKDGVFDFTQFPQGSAITVNGGNTTDLGTLTLLEGGYLTGTITDKNGSPVKDAVVVAMYGGTGADYFITADETNSDGIYWLALPEATYTLIYAYLGAKNGSITNLFIEKNQTTTTGDITIEE